MAATLLPDKIQTIHSYRITVLLVDDQPMIAEAVRRALEDEHDIAFHYCPDPTKAIKIANEIKPTIILQDLVMPEVEGLMMVRFFRVNPQTSQVPIIILSTKEDPSIKGEAFTIGVNDYLVKLPDKIELIARIRYHSKAYISGQQRDEAFAALLESQKSLEAANRALERLSSLDGLTGIANRRSFDSTLAQEWPRAMRHGHWLSLIMIDIDYFKPYNDTYGHQGGDHCLRQVAKILQSAEKRSTDLVARYGGEEFAIILPQTDQLGAIELAKVMLAKVREQKIPHVKSGVSDFLSISLGVSTMIPPRESRAELLIVAADQALYRAKAEGRNRVVVAEPITESEPPAPEQKPRATT